MTFKVSYNQIYSVICDSVSSGGPFQPLASHESIILEAQWAGPLPISQAHTLCVDPLKSMARYLCLLVFVPCLALHVRFLFGRAVGALHRKAQHCVMNKRVFTKQQGLL